MIKRRKTREVKVGNLIVGGEHAVTVQSMTTTKTHDIKATLKEVERLEEAGCQIIRITVPDQPAADALYEIKKKMNVPLVADIHFNYRMALEAVDAGADKIRINPGNIGGKNKVKEVLDKVSSAGLPIRIGVNAGSLEKDLIEKYGFPTPEATDGNVVAYFNSKLQLNSSAKSLPLFAILNLFKFTLGFPFLLIQYTESLIPNININTSIFFIFCNNLKFLIASFVVAPSKENPNS